MPAVPGCSHARLSPARQPIPVGAPRLEALPWPLSYRKREDLTMPRSLSGPPISKNEAGVLAAANATTETDY
jgi:hypothetical protein